MASKKKAISKSGFIPANAEQSASIKAIRAFIEDGNPDEYFTLLGKAGPVKRRSSRKH
jgi:hypothetical protein